jgi:hypothetical protein
MPNHLQIGDELAILHGCIVPFILRYNDDRYRQLIGEAFVHGIMDGEFMNTEAPIQSFESV